MLDTYLARSNALFQIAVETSDDFRSTETPLDPPCVAISDDAARKSASMPLTFGNVRQQARWRVLTPAPYSFVSGSYWQVRTRYHACWRASLEACRRRFSLK